MSGGLDWPALIRVGIYGLKLSPEVFWTLTPAELRVMLGEMEHAAPMSSEGLGALMSAWPDQEKGS